MDQPDTALLECSARASAPGARPTSPAMRPLAQTAPAPGDAWVRVPQALLSAVAAASLAACGGGGGAPPPSVPAPAPDTTGGGTVGAAVPNRELAPNTDTAAARFLQRAQFSSTQAEIAQLRKGTYAAWLIGQFGQRASQTAWDWLESRTYGENNIHRYFFRTGPAEHALWKQLFSAPDAMRMRLALALSEFFVVSLNSAEFNWRSHAMANWWDMLVRHAFGNFRTLLKDVSLHPVMGYFLNTKGNQKEDATTGRLPDENYAREVMQLFSIGLTQLNLDGSNKLVGGKPADSYTQDDVTHLARVFTGYDFDSSDGVREEVLIEGGGVESYKIESKQFARKPMRLDPKKHSTLEAKFLGTTVPAGTSGEAAMDTAIDTLFNHPNTAPFFCRQMIQRLVTSNPSPAYVRRVASVFVNNGAGVRGDMKSVWAAILLDDEALGSAGLQDAGFGKLREPMLRLVQWGRTFGATSAAGSWKLFDLSDASRELGQSPLRAPSVFNFFRPGFVPPGTAMARSGATTPEFQLVNETSVGGYLNFMQRTIREGLYTPEPTVPQPVWDNYLPDIQATYAQELALVQDATALVSKINLTLCAGQLSTATQAIMVNALNKTPLPTTGTVEQKRDRELDRVCAAVFMAMACGEYLVQK